MGSEVETGSVADLHDRYLAALREAIARHRIYPQSSRELGETGSVGVAFSVLADGTIADVHVVNPSDYARLNMAAAESVKRVIKVQPIPAPLGSSALNVSLTLDYSLF